MRRVALATPALDGRVECEYAYALAETRALGLAWGVLFLPLMVAREAIIEEARNDLFGTVYLSGVDDVIWIDSDMSWEPQQALRLLWHPVDVVGGTTRHKTDAETYVVKRLPGNNMKVGANGLIEVEALGCGFLRMSRAAIVKLWEASEPYLNKNKREQRWAFDVRPINGEIVSEDVMASVILRKAGFPIYLDPAITCNHFGTKKFSGDFLSWLRQANIQAA